MPEVVQLDPVEIRIALSYMREEYSLQQTAAMLKVADGEGFELRTALRINGLVIEGIKRGLIDLVEAKS